MIKQSLFDTIHMVLAAWSHMYSEEPKKGKKGHTVLSGLRLNDLYGHIPLIYAWHTAMKRLQFNTGIQTAVFNIAATPEGSPGMI